MVHRVVLVEVEDVVRDLMYDFNTTAAEPVALAQEPPVRKEYPYPDTCRVARNTAVVMFFTRETDQLISRTYFGYRS